MLDVRDALEFIEPIKRCITDFFVIKPQKAIFNTSIFDFICF